MPRGIHRTLCSLVFLLTPLVTQAADIPDTSLTPLKFLVGEWKGRIRMARPTRSPSPSAPAARPSPKS